MTDTPKPPKPKLRRGFAAMSPSKRTALAPQGVEPPSQPPAGPSPQDPELAMSAGRKGGQHSKGGRSPQRLKDTPGTKPND